MNTILNAKRMTFVLAGHLRSASDNNNCQLSIWLPLPIWWNKISSIIPTAKTNPETKPLWCFNRLLQLTGENARSGVRIPLFEEYFPLAKLSLQCVSNTAQASLIFIGVHKYTKGWETWVRDRCVSDCDRSITTGGVVADSERLGSLIDFTLNKCEHEMLC